MEIERRFLFDSLPEEARQIQPKRIIQGYLSFEPEVRLRQMDDRYYRTEKQGEGLVREEREEKISQDTFQSLFPKCGRHYLEKLRYMIPLSDGLVAEADVFLGKLAGLQIVEVEFSSLEEAKVFTPPAWFLHEVTEETKYRNKNLCKIEG